MILLWWHTYLDKIKKLLFDTMTVSEKGLQIIKTHEGWSAKPYLCPAGVPTIGYGNTFYEDDTKVKMTDAEISLERGEQLLRTTLKRFEVGVKKLATGSDITLTQNEFDALVSFSYNVGLAALSNSTLWIRIVAYKDGKADIEDVAYQFSRWNKGGGRVLNGLVKRRKEEADLFKSA